MCAYVYLAAEALDVFHLLIWKGFCLFGYKRKTFIIKFFFNKCVVREREKNNNTNIFFTILKNLIRFFPHILEKSAMMFYICHFHVHYVINYVIIFNVTFFTIYISNRLNARNMETAADMR